MLALRHPDVVALSGLQFQLLFVGNHSNVGPYGLSQKGSFKGSYKGSIGFWV